MLMQVTARILQIRPYPEKPSLKGIFQQIIIRKLEDGDYARLCPVKDNDGIYKVYGRSETWMRNNYNPEGLTLLPHTHRLSYLYARWIHNQDHKIIRNIFWIPRVKQIVTNKCVICKRLNKKTQEQIMGSLPDCRMKPTPAFHVTFLDLFGPYIIRGVVNKRSRSKCFGMILTCGVSRAVYCDVVQDYGTDIFLQTVRRYTNLRGYPSVIYSNSGSQLVKANKEFEHQKIKEFGVEKGLVWNFSTPSAPWKNGCAEALVKSIKKATSVAIGDHVLSFPELQTFIFEAANLVTERLIAVNSSHLDDGSYLCPNDLLLGRASSSVPGESFEECTNP